MSNRLEAAPVTMAKDGEDAPPKRPLFGFLRGASEKKKDIVESDFARLRSLQQARREEATDADRLAQIEATADRQGRIDHLVERLHERDRVTAPLDHLAAQRCGLELQHP